MTDPTLSLTVDGENTITYVDDESATLSIDADTEAARLVAEVDDDKHGSIRIPAEDAKQVAFMLSQYAEHVDIGTIDEDTTYHWEVEQTDLEEESD